jgi:Tol biopolymer transport system component
VAEQVGSYYFGLFSVSANGVLAYGSVSLRTSQLAWFDRGGKPLGTLGPPAHYFGNLALSPDGRRVAADEMDQAGNPDIWVLDVARGVPTRFTFEGKDNYPTWSPDGTQLVFGSMLIGGANLEIYRKDSSGTGKEELLLKPGLPCDWSPDGRYLLYRVQEPKTRTDLWVLSAPAGPPDRHKPMPYLQTTSNETQGRFSPDGHWIAYTSDESGTSQTYVQSFPVGAPKVQVSTAGGIQPRWRRAGKEIFYVAADGKLMAVGVQTTPKFEAGAPKALFDPRIARGVSRDAFGYDVTADGKRFLVNTTSTAPESSVAAPIKVVVNWQAALKR